MRISILNFLMISSICFSGVALAENSDIDPRTDTSTDSHAMSFSDFNWSKGWYVGAGINRTANNNFNLSYDAVGEYTYESDLSADTQKVGVGVLVGWHYNPWLAFEAAYNSYGSNSYSGTDGDADYSENTQIDYYGMWSGSLVGVLSTPSISGLSAHVKGGAAYFSQNWKGTTTTEVYSSSYSVSESSSGAEFTYGFGLEYDYKQFGISFDWMRIDLGSSASYDYSLQNDLDQYSLTLLYNFG
jgi:hypothetical protein